VKADFFAGKDFIIADISDPYDGKPTSIRDYPTGTPITLRYKGLTMLTCVKCKPVPVPTVIEKPIRPGTVGAILQHKNECKAVTDMFNGKGVSDD